MIILTHDEHMQTSDHCVKALACRASNLTSIHNSGVTLIWLIVCSCVTSLRQEREGKQRSN